MSPLGQKLEKIAKYIIVDARVARREIKFATPTPCLGEGRHSYPQDSLVYDVGANNGDDTEYYLRQGFRVVAVEANPDLAASIVDRFRVPISEGRLTVINAAVVNDDRRSTVLYVHISNDVLSTTVPPEECSTAFRPISVDACRLSDMISTFGDPLFVKIDVEGADKDVLSDLFKSGLRPPYLSAEAHAIEVFCHLVAAGYRRFKVVEGHYTHSPYYQNTALSWNATPLDHRFAVHSSGPFGEDVPGSWMSADEIFGYLAEEGLGWKDLHAAW